MGGTNDLHRWALYWYGAINPAHWEHRPAEEPDEFEVHRLMDKLLEVTREKAPELPIYVVGIPPRPLDAHQTEAKRRSFNRWLRGWVRSLDEMAPTFYIEPDTWCLHPNGETRRHIFYNDHGKGDGIHFSNVGAYHITRQLREILPTPPVQQRPRYLAFNRHTNSFRMQKDIRPLAPRPDKYKRKAPQDDHRPHAKRRAVPSKDTRRSVSGVGRPSS